MKIKSEQDVKILDQRIQSELGVDVKKYRNDEVVETFVSMLVFIEYFITWVIGPIVGALLLYGLGFWLLDLVHVEYGIYGLVGLILFLITGIFLGLLLLTGRMKEDVWGIVHYSLDIMKSAKADTAEVMANMPAQQKKASTAMLFQGVLHLVTIPTLATVIEAKIPILGMIVSRFIKKVLTMVSNSLAKEEEILIDPNVSKADSQQEISQQRHKDASFGKIRKAISIPFGIARLPIKIFFYISLILLLLFLYIIH